jgi:hypothetical protein
MATSLVNAGALIGLKVIQVDQKGGELAIVKSGEWIGILADVAQYLIEQKIKESIQLEASSDLVRLHEDSLAHVANIVRREINRARAEEYMADSNYVIREMEYWRLTGVVDHLNNARDRASLLISRVKTLGDEYLGALMVATNNLIVALLATEHHTGNGGYRDAARSVVREYGFNGIMGHGTNRLRYPLEDRVRRVGGCICRRVNDPYGGHWACRCTDSDGNPHDSTHDDQDQARSDCESQRDRLKRAAQDELNSVCQTTINPWRATMSLWEQI